MPWVKTNDGVKIHYKESGKGDPLLIIHGWSYSSNCFNSNIEELSKHLHVVAMDIRGHGDSDKPKWGYRISRLARDVKDLIDTLNLKNVSLMGWSMGASIIWSYYEIFQKENLNKLITIDQSPKQYYSPDWKLGQAGCYDAESYAILATRLMYEPEKVALETLELSLSHDPTEKEKEFFLKEMQKSPGWVRAKVMADHTNLDWRDLLSTIELPSLVIVGRKSKIFSWEGSAYVGKLIPNSRTVFFESSGHMPFYEESKKFNKTILDFLE